jgi:BlaI family penicillinase repressor
MVKVPHIRETEWMVMEVLWDRSPLTSLEVVQALARIEAWQPTTVKTMLGRLKNRKAVGMRKKGNIYLYRPLVSRADCIQHECESFMQLVFGGAIKPLFQHFCENHKLAPEDLDDLKKLLEQPER